MADELKDQRIPIMMSPSEVKAIDDWMFSSRIKSRSEAIRRLCQVGLAASEDIGKARESTQIVLKEIFEFNANNMKENFANLDVYRQLTVTKGMLKTIIENIAGPFDLIQNVHDIVHLYKNWDFPEDLGFQDGKTIIEAVGYLRSKKPDEES